MFGKWPIANLFLARAGFFTVSVDYRLAPGAHYPAQIHGAKTAVRWLRTQASKLGIDPNRIAAWGVSAGAHLAALLGTALDKPLDEGEDGGWVDVSSHVQAVANVCGVTDFLDPAYPMDTRALFGAPVEERPDLARMASPVSFTSANSAPFLHLHGLSDEHV